MLVVRARTPDLVLEVLVPARDERVVFDPRGGGDPLPASVALEFFVRESDPAALVGIVDRRENLARVLDRSVALAADEPVRYRWDGRDDGGRIAPQGRYRLLVELPSRDREMVFPRRFTLVSGDR